MPPITLYEISIPVFIRSLKNLSAILKKGQSFADEKGIPHEDLTGAKLVDDMGGLPFQVQRVSDTAKLAAVRIGGIESVGMEDNETTFEQMQERVQKTIAFLEKVEPSSINGKEEAEVQIKRSSGPITLNGTDYMLKFALPNFFFHVTTAYGILRHKGVPVGKWDYLGKPDQ